MKKILFMLSVGLWTSLQGMAYVDGFLRSRAIEALFNLSGFSFLDAIPSKIASYNIWKNEINEINDEKALRFLENICKERNLEVTFMQSPVNNGSPMYACGNVVVIDTEHYAKLCNLLKESEQNNEEKLNWYKAVLHHELTHMIERDDCYANRFILLIMSASCVTSYGLKNMSSLFFPENSHIRNGINCGAFALPIIAQALLPSYVRYREQQADEKIPDELPVLRAVLNAFNEEDSSKCADKKGVFSKISSYLRKHPAKAVRVQRLQERINRLQGK